MEFTYTRRFPGGGTITRRDFGKADTTIELTPTQDRFVAEALHLLVDRLLPVADAESMADFTGALEFAVGVRRQLAARPAESEEE